MMEEIFPHIQRIIRKSESEVITFRETQSLSLN